MAEKPEELNIRDIKLLEYNIIGKGVIKLDNEDLGFFEKETWKLFVTTIGWKILENQKEKITGECMIQFFSCWKGKTSKICKTKQQNFFNENFNKTIIFYKI